METQQAPRTLASASVQENSNFCQSGTGFAMCRQKIPLHPLPTLCCRGCGYQPAVPRHASTDLASPVPRDRGDFTAWTPSNSQTYGVFAFNPLNGAKLSDRGSSVEMAAAEGEAVCADIICVDWCFDVVWDKGCDLAETCGVKV